MTFWKGGNIGRGDIGIPRAVYFTVRREDGGPVFCEVAFPSKFSFIIDF
jgi:hypothetical protein